MGSQYWDFQAFSRYTGMSEGESICYSSDGSGKMSERSNLKKIYCPTVLGDFSLLREAWKQGQLCPCCV